MADFDLRGEFECCKCQHVFRMIPGAHVECPQKKCRSLYVRWLDYPRFAEASPSEPRVQHFPSKP